MKRWLVRILVVLIGLLGALLVAGWLANEKRPAGTPSAEADALAHRVEAAVDKAAWDRTGAVRWSFGDRDTHLWDRVRNLDRVSWGDNEVQIDLASKKGLAMKAGKKLEGAEADKLLESAYGRWANDSFWLNPLAKLFDEGTSRALVPLKDGGQGLLVSYASGGVTPGDAYLWKLGRDDLPTSWKLWVGILPIGGLEVTWENWITLSTGAKIATRHAGLIPFELKGVEGAESLSALEREDPFAALVGQPSSQPAQETPEE